MYKMESKSQNTGDEKDKMESKSHNTSDEKNKINILQNLGLIFPSSVDNRKERSKLIDQLTMMSVTVNSIQTSLETACEMLPPTFHMCNSNVNADTKQKYIDIINGFINNLKMLKIYNKKSNTIAQLCGEGKISYSNGCLFINEFIYKIVKYNSDLLLQNTIDKLLNKIDNVENMNTNLNINNGGANVFDGIPHTFTAY